jgi:hypothetical protein
MSCLYTSLQNDKVEHTLCTINNMICSLLFQASMPARYWVEGFHAAMYLLNRLPCKAINVSFSYAAIYGVTPSYEHLSVFDCACYPNLFAQAAHKLALGPLIVSSSDTLLITKVISVSISPDMLFLMRQSSPLLSHPI